MITCTLFALLALALIGPPVAISVALWATATQDTTEDTEQ